MRETVVRCRLCGADDGEIVLDLGRQPSWDRMPSRDAPLPDPVFDLRMWFCHRCSLAQLCSDAGDSEELLAVEPRSVAEQSELSIGRMWSEGLAAVGRTVAEFGSPHGESWLPRLAAAGMTAVPPGGSADLVVDFYGLLHQPDQHASLRRRADALAPDGTLVLQMLSLGTVLAREQWFDLRHGHYAYWSLPALDSALRRYGLGIHRAWWYPLSGGTLLVAACRDPRPDPSTRELMERERTLGVLDPDALRGLQRAASGGAEVLRTWLVAERRTGRTVLGYGAASRAVPLVCHAGLTAELLPLVGDASPAKQGRRMPGTDIPIVAPSEVRAARPDRVLLFLPELADEVRDAMPDVESAGGRWVVLDPEPRVLVPALIH